MFSDDGGIDQQVPCVESELGKARQGSGIRFRAGELGTRGESQQRHSRFGHDRPTAHVGRDGQRPTAIGPEALGDQGWFVIFSNEEKTDEPAPNFVPHEISLFLL
jgi:hypothetical protein